MFEALGRMSISCPPRFNSHNDVGSGFSYLIIHLVFYGALSTRSTPYTSRRVRVRVFDALVLMFVRSSRPVTPPFISSG